MAIPKSFFPLSHLVRERIQYIMEILQKEGYLQEISSYEVNELSERIARMIIIELDRAREGEEREKNTGRKENRE